ncbi:hypothetical protein [Vibrio sp. WXL210]|uniref:hypothetical protein n=1 Tax=Vibrio sp. WXL210 TaxID=3450709 RepID=UPI003EC528C2
MKATFWTEFSGDNGRALMLLEEMGVNDTDVVRNGNAFTFQLPEAYTLDQFGEDMAHLIWSDDRFADLHRCTDTLKEGEQPKERFYE